MSEKEKTIQRIIAAAVEVFSAVGFAGARMDEIALQADVNKATIYYNIGNKETLYARVLQTVFDDTVERLTEELAVLETPAEKLRFYLQAIARRIDEHPHIPNLIMWEHAAGGKNISEEFAGEVVRIICVLADILKEGEQAGCFHPVDPFLLHSLIIGSFLFYKTSIPIRNSIDAFPETLKNYPEALSGNIARIISGYILGIVQKQKS